MSENQDHRSTRVPDRRQKGNGRSVHGREIGARGRRLYRWTQVPVVASRNGVWQGSRNPGPRRGERARNQVTCSAVTDVCCENR